LVANSVAISVIEANRINIIDNELAGLVGRNSETFRGWPRQEGDDAELESLLRRRKGRTEGHDEPRGCTKDPLIIIPA